MGLTSLFFEMKDKNVLVIGTGSVGIRRSKRFLDAGANVSILTHDIDKQAKIELEGMGAKFYDDNNRDKLIDECDLVVIATDNIQLNEEIALKAEDKLVNCASDISLSNIIVPSTFNIGDVTISIYTGNKSPLMAKKLRKKIQNIITPIDILNIELQEKIRPLLKENVDSQIKRKEYMIEINNNPIIQSYLEEGDIDSAFLYVKENLLNG